VIPNRASPVDDGEERVLSVSELTAAIKDLLESSFPEVWVVGEISNLARPRSGHCYLTLKDEGAQLPAVIWRSTTARMRFNLDDGLEVICRGRIGVYPPHGKYQLAINRIQPRGIGGLELAFRQLREKLAREGLFEPARKQPLPRMVRTVAVVTSPSGAAIRDFLEVLRRRSPWIDVLIVPVRVQGEEAAEEIAEAVDLINRLKRTADCLVVTRGGGSLEDLWAFNEEIVVRAIFASGIPVVSAVGHEIDVTLSDLAADVRALTPTEAAERITISAGELTTSMRQLQERMWVAVRSRASGAKARLKAVASTRVLRRPFERVYELGQRVDELASRGQRACRSGLQLARHRLDSLAARLDSLSPLSVLGRGYSLTQRADDGRVVRKAAELSAGDRIHTRFGQGTTTSRVEEVSPDA
jgi:exodeoxyribonuclease VII large subunit